MRPSRPHALAAAVSLLLLVAYPVLAVPEAVAPSHPEAIGAGIQGMVRSNAGGPLGGAFVGAKGPNGSGSAVSAPNGSYHIELPPGTYSVTVSARAHKDANATAVVSGALPSAQDFTLVHTGIVVRGTAVDAKTGKPLGGVLVQADQHPSGCGKGEPCPAIEPARPEIYRVPASTVTNANGTFALAVEAGYASFRFAKDGYRDVHRGVEGKDDQRLDVRLPPVPAKTAVLAGRVVDAATGKPLAGAWVSAWPHYEAHAADGSASGDTASTAVMPAPSCPPEADCVAPYPCCDREGNSTSTDKDGRFRMAMQPGKYGFQAGAHPYGMHSEVLTLADGQTLDREVALEPIPPDSVPVKGRVVDAATGKPVGGAWVSIENQKWGAWNGTATDADGRFDLRTKPGWAMIWVRAERGVYTAATPVASTPPSSGEASGSSGSSGASAGHGSQADGNTTESIRAPDEPAGRRHMEPEGAYYPWLHTGVLEEGKPLSLEVRLQPKPAADVRLQGYVLNASSGKPIPGATVNVRNEDTGDWGWAQTDKDGSFVLLGRAGVHTVQAYAENHYQNAVVVKVEGPATRVDLRLEPGRTQGCCIAYAEMAKAADGSGPYPATPPATSQTAGSPGGTQGGQAQAPSQPAAVRGSGDATYASAGGLGPYQGSQASPGKGDGLTQGDRSGRNNTPGPGLIGVAAALALAGLALAARRRR